MECSSEKTYLHSGSHPHRADQSTSRRSTSGIFQKDLGIDSSKALLTLPSLTPSGKASLQAQTSEEVENSQSHVPLLEQDTTRKERVDEATS